MQPKKEMSGLVYQSSEPSECNRCELQKELVTEGAPVQTKCSHQILESVYTECIGAHELHGNI